MNAIPPGLALDGVTKSFGRTPVLTGVGLSAAAGTLTAVLGRSGCGKTTLLRIVAGFEHPDTGTVALHGREVASAGHALPPEQRGIGYLTQEGALFPHLTVSANVLFGLPWRERRHGGRRAAALLETVDLDPALAARYPHELSGGQQQRVALARALAPEPAVVLLDEPFSSLDAGLRVETQQAVIGALAKSGSTGVLVTHDRAEALALADQVAVMQDGAIAQVAAPDAVYRDPVDPTVGMLVGDAILLAGRRVDAATVRCVLGTLPVRHAPVGDVSAWQVLLRPEQLVVERGGQGVAARVRTCEFRGPELGVELDLGDGCVVASRLPGESSIAPGDDVTVTVRGTVNAYSSTIRPE